MAFAHDHPELSWKQPLNEIANLQSNLHRGNLMATRMNLEMSGTTVCVLYTNSGETHQLRERAILTDKFLEIIHFSIGRLSQRNFR